MTQEQKDLVFVAGLTVMVGIVTMVCWWHYGRQLPQPGTEAPAAGETPGDPAAATPDTLVKAAGNPVSGRLVQEQSDYYVMEKDGQRRLYFKQEVSRIIRRPQYQPHARYEVTLINDRHFTCDVAEETDRHLVVRVGAGLHRIPKSKIKEIK